MKKEFFIGIFLLCLLSSFGYSPTITKAAGSLFAYWRFNETSAGSIVSDSSGNGYDGTPIGSGGAQNLPQPSLELPPVSFPNTRSMSFDGIDDHVDIPDWSIDMSSGFSVSVWAKPTASKS